MAVSAIFGGLLTKVGVYALIRVFTLLFLNNVDYTHTIILWAGGITMVTGVLGAVAQYEFRRLLSFHIVSQIGYMIMGLGFFTPLALAGTVFFIVHNIFVKTNLFLVSGVSHRLHGTYDLKKLGGLYRSHPWLAMLFLLSALSLAGVPPLSGFFGKLVLIKAGLGIGQFVLVAAALGVSLLTLFSMTKIWAEAFWKPSAGGHRGEPAGRRHGSHAGSHRDPRGSRGGDGCGRRTVLRLGATGRRAVDEPGAVHPGGAPGEGRIMTVLLWNIMLALSWAALAGEVTALSLAVGFVLGFVILYSVRRLLRPSRYFEKLWQCLRLAGLFAWELVLANLRIAYEVVTPSHNMRPGVVAIPLDAETDAEITLLANLITLTPGTLSLDVSDDRRVLYIHAMYVDDVEELRRSIKDGFEKRVMELLR